MKCLLMCCCPHFCWDLNTPWNCASSLGTCRRLNYTASYWVHEGLAYYQSSYIDRRGDLFGIIGLLQIYWYGPEICLIKCELAGPTPALRPHACATLARSDLHACIVMSMSNHLNCCCAVHCFTTWSTRASKRASLISQSGYKSRSRLACKPI